MTGTVSYFLSTSVLYSTQVLWRGEVEENKKNFTEGRSLLLTPPSRVQVKNDKEKKGLGIQSKGDPPLFFFVRSWERNQFQNSSMVHRGSRNCSGHGENFLGGSLQQGSLNPVRLFVTPMDCGVFCPWDSPGKNIGVGCHSLLQRIFLTQGLKLGLLHCRQILYHLSQRNEFVLTSSIGRIWTPFWPLVICVSFPWPHQPRCYRRAG